jgi:hypothetical protein
MRSTLAFCLGLALIGTITLQSTADTVVPMGSTTGLVPLCDLRTGLYLGTYMGGLSGHVDSIAGDLNYYTGAAPWIAWGPYLWADGLNPRSDGLIWDQRDVLSSDGTHPSTFGQQKVATMLLDSLLASPFSRTWFRGACVAGDIDGDGHVDVYDLLTFVGSFGRTLGQNGYDPTCDLDGDNTVDVVDLLTLVEVWGQ